MTPRSKTYLKGRFNAGSPLLETDIEDLVDSYNDALSSGINDGLTAASSPSASNPFVTATTLDTEVTAALNVHAALQTVHGLTANYIGALGAAANISASNPVVAVAGTPRVTLGTPGAVNGELILASHDREDYAAYVFQADFSGHPDPVFFLGYNPPNSTGYNSAESSIYMGFEGYYWIHSGDQEYVEWYIPWRTANGTYSGRAWQTSVEINTGFVNSYIYADNLVIGNGAGNVNYWQIIGGAGQYNIPLQIVGSSDAVQLLVKGNATQTNYIFQIQNSSGDGLFNFTTSGRFAFNALSHPTDQIWAFDYTLQSSANGADVYMYGQRFSVIRDNGGPTFSWTYGINAAVTVRGLTANALSRYSYAGHFEIAVQANPGRSASVSVSTNIIESRLTKLGGGGTEAFAAPHGIDIGDMGGTGSYTPAAVYIAAQTTPTSGAPYAIQSVSGRVLLGGLPTSAAGLASGELWNNGGAINIVA